MDPKQRYRHLPVYQRHLPVYQSQLPVYQSQLPVYQSQMPVYELISYICRQLPLYHLPLYELI